MAFRAIAVATDGSVAAGHAVDVAIALARHDGARLVVCSVADDALMASADPYGGSGNSAALAESVDEATSACSAGATRAAAAGVEATVSVTCGIPADQIVSVAVAAGVDAVVMATQGRRGFERLMLGSTAADVLRLSFIPTIVVPAAWDATRTLTRGVLLVALDDSAPSNAAFEFALQYAEPATRLVLCNVVAQYGLPDRERFERRATEARARGFAADVVVADGVAAEQILATARACDAGAIVIGTHGRRGVHRLLLGSVAEIVIRGADIPVIVVPKTSALALERPLRLERVGEAPEHVV
jgi:nucleotide-binding universal stress UspA family protein